ncbi:MAG: hypothetical protein V4582_08550 [Pseudomonadota bacterium]
MIEAKTRAAIALALGALTAPLARATDLQEVSLSAGGGATLHGVQAGTVTLHEKFFSTPFSLGQLVLGVQAMAYGGGRHGRPGGAPGFHGVGVANTLGLQFDALTVLARLGAGYNWSRPDVAGAPAAGSGVLLLGVGADLALGPKWSLRADLDRVPGAEQQESMNLVSLGASYRF